MTPPCFSRDGRPLDFESWWRLFRDPRYQELRVDEIGRCMVSTVWLGVDHSFGMGGPPLIFETMVFGPDRDDGAVTDLERVRYATEEQALAGHAEVADLVRKLGDLDSPTTTRKDGW